MAKTKISEYSSTANSNTDIASINIDEGCAPSGINNAIRALMAQLKNFQTGADGDSFNGPVGSTTPAAGAFTTLSASSTLSVTGAGTIQGLTVGKGAGAVSTNTAVGASALAANTTGSENTAYGASALAANTTGTVNTAIGNETLYSVTTGATQNVAVGHRVGYANTTGSYNSGFGALALRFNTTGSYNVALGTSALQSNTTASNNTAVGYQAGYSNTVGTWSTFLGQQAGYSLNRTADINSYCTFIGGLAGYFTTTGNFNTFVGEESGYYVTTGAKNTILGRYNGNQGGLDIRTAGNNIVLSDGDGAVGMRLNLSSANGVYLIWDQSQLFPSVDNQVKLGYPSFRWSTVYAGTGTINTSDANQKQDIASLDDAEKRVAVAIKSLIKKYRFKDAVAEKGDAARIHVGAVAQEVQAAFVTEGLDPTRYALFCSDTWYEVDGKPAQNLNEPYTAETEGAVEVTRLGLRYEELLAFVIAAM